MYIGVDYYPEHWPRSRWSTDAALMKRAGFNVVRLAEFAWAFMEPEEGRFDFVWLDDALAILAKNGISAILGTPTAVMPAWCAKKYPETLAMQKDGTRIVWGVRKNNCFRSGTYRLLSERITTAMAAHFAKTPNIIGWQTDNEFGGPVCYCDGCRSEFHQWLAAKYGEIGDLNRAWGNHFWGHIFRHWDEIPIPVDPAAHNPSALLDWQRFQTFLNVRFQHDQVRTIRRCCPDHFVTHNFMGLFPDLDYYKLAEDLDHVSWDNYPIGDDIVVRYGSSAGADLMRGLKKQNFWIMEQTAGPHGWGTFGRNPRPGEIRSYAWQQVAHGADAMIWFRWRSCTAGREQYWHGLLGHDGRPLRRYREASATAVELHRLAPQLAGTTLRPKVAMIFDYDSLWATRFQPGFQKNEYRHAMRRYYDALFRAGVSVDMVKPGDDLAGYRLVFASNLHVLPDAVARQLVAYVRDGGVLLADIRTGVKDETNLCHDRTLPGLLSDALGITIEEYEAIDKIEYDVRDAAKPDVRYTSIQYVDWLTPTTAQSLAVYATPHLKKFAAATRNTFGKGAGYYVGTVIKEDSFYDALVGEILHSARIRPLVKVPQGVEAAIREGKGKRLLVLVNHMQEPRTVAVPAGKAELISGRKTQATLKLPAFGVAVVRL